MMWETPGSHHVTQPGSPPIPSTAKFSSLFREPSVLWLFQKLPFFISFKEVVLVQGVSDAASFVTPLVAKWQNPNTQWLT